MGKKIALGTIAGFIGLMVGGFLVYGVIMKDAMSGMAEASGGCMSAEPSALLMIIGTLIQAFVFTIVLYKFNISTLAKGAVTILWLMLLISVMYDSWFYGSFDWVTPKMVLTDIISNAIMAPIAGGVIGWVLGKV